MMPSPSVTFRPAAPSDAAFLASITRRLGQVPLPPGRAPGEVAEADLRQLLDALARPREDMCALIAEQDGQPAGCVFVTTEFDFFTGLPEAHVEVVAVKPESEGRGLAKLLIGAGEEWARSRGMTHATLNVFLGNTRARAVYEHLGYAAEILKYRKQL